MASIKITELPSLTALSANNANTVFVVVDKTTNTTSQFSTTVLAQGLYANNILNVGTSNTGLLLPNSVAQFISNTAIFSQVNFQNLSKKGSADIVITADNGDNSNNYLDLGVQGSDMDADPTFDLPNDDGYLYMHGKSNQKYGNLWIGTAIANTDLVFFTGDHKQANEIGRFKDGVGLSLKMPIKFADGTTQNTAAPNVVTINANTIYTQGVDATQNTRLNSIETINTNQNTSISIIEGVNLTQNTNITAVNNYAASGYAKANTAVQNTAIIQLQALTLTGNLIANSVGQGIFVDTFISNSATFSRNVTILGNLTANTLAGNVFFSNVTVGSSQANSIQWFAQTESPTQTSGQVWYSANTISLVQDTDIAGDRPAISKVLFERVYNNTGSAIPNSSWVRLAGNVTSNSVPFIQLADATSAANSQVEGFVKVGIAAGAYGFVYTRGIVSDLDASSFGNNGQLLFLSTTPGQASNVAPTGANSVVQVAKILSNGSANGKLQVSISNLQAYGKPNGAILFANNNLIQASNTLFINETIGQLNVSSTLYAANGIINRVSQYPSTQTAITISMTTDTWVKCNVGASLAITPTSFVPGAEVVVIVTNPNSGGGAARTITHGAAAVNSSVGATTFSLGGTTTAFIKYYSFDGDLANTYVQVTYS